MGRVDLLLRGKDLAEKRNSRKCLYSVWKLDAWVVCLYKPLSQAGCQLSWWFQHVTFHRAEIVPRRQCFSCMLLLSWFPWPRDEGLKQKQIALLKVWLNQLPRAERCSTYSIHPPDVWTGISETWKGVVWFCLFCHLHFSSCSVLSFILFLFPIWILSTIGKSEVFLQI